ncbi:putative ribonuclease H-like domain-containing protein [Tanacetum coccineum]|uniref:Ribonuclease H-like domain-containing protein n=1 Tax=Tanacetum coccineum TaxID=301880 RepID=A0ABQ4YMR6_9ASTR
MPMWHRRCRSSKLPSSSVPLEIQDYALWEVIENGNSWVPILVTTPESGPSTSLKMTVPSTTKEKICKKNDVKARSLLLMALPNEHQLTFNQYVDAQSMFVAIKARFGGNDATKKTQKALLKQQCRKFNDYKAQNHWNSIVNRLKSFLDEQTDFDTMGLDDLYNNFKIVEQKVKRTAAANNDDKNLAFLTTSSPSSTNTINTVNTGVSTGNTKVNTASTASFSDATVYGIWHAKHTTHFGKKFYQRTGRKIIIDGSSTAGYDKSKVECFNCHKMGHFARECRAPRSKDNRNWNQGSSSKAVRIEDASEKAMCAIDGAGFDWSDMSEDEIQANMTLDGCQDSEKQYDDLLVKLDDTGFKAATYKRGLSILEAQVVEYKESGVLFSEELALLKRSIGHKEYLMGLLKTELEKVKEEKEGFEFKIAKFEKSSKDLDDLLASQVTDKSKRGFGYNAVPSPHPLILNRPTPLDLSYSGLEEFKQPKVNEYGPRNSSLKPTTVCDRESDNSKENTDESLTEQTRLLSENSSVKSPTLRLVSEDGKKLSYPNEQFNEDWPKNCYNARPVNTSNSQLNDKGFVDSGCSRHMSGNIAHLSDFKDFDGGYVTFGRGANGGRITGKEFKNNVLDEFVEKGIKREYSVARTPQQNGVAERKNRTLIEAARTMLADSKLPTTFWAEAVSTACYVQNRVLIVKPHNKTPYELFRGIQGVSESSISSQQDQDYQDGTHDDCSLQNNGTDDQQVNTASPEVNTGTREVSTTVPEVYTTTPEDLIGPIPTSEDTQVEDQEIELGNISPSYAVSSTPHTRIHKDHPLIWIGDVQSSVFKTRRMTHLTTDLGFLDLLKVIGLLVQCGSTETRKMNGGLSSGTSKTVAQGHLRRGIDYDESLLQWLELRQIRYSWLMTSYMGFTVYTKWIVKSAFLRAVLVMEFEKLLKDKFREFYRRNSHSFWGCRSMIGSLMYLTTSRPDIMFAVCAVQVLVSKNFSSS